MHKRLLNIMRMSCVAIVLLLTFPSGAADEAQEGEWKQQCDNIKELKSVFFQRLAQKIIKSKQLFCNFKISNDDLYINDFIDVFELLLPYTGEPAAISDASVKLQRLINAGQFPQVIFEASDVDLLLNMVPLQLLNQEVKNNSIVPQASLLNACNSRANSIKAGSSCNDVLKEFQLLYGEAQSFYSLYTAIKTKYQLKAVMKQWDDYLDSSRSQTPLELLVNGYFYKKKEASHFQPPPSGQFILLHPALVIEDVNSAADGENTKQSLIIDVIGYDWWVQDSWYLPSGFSYSRIYSDRAGVKDWGDGISLHFRSQFTLGYSKHKDEEGVYISVDLLKLFEDKKKVFEEYKQSF